MSIDMLPPVVRVQFPDGIREVPCHFAPDPRVTCSFNPNVRVQHWPTPDPMEGWEFSAVYPMGDQPGWVAHEVAR